MPVEEVVLSAAWWHDILDHKMVTCDVEYGVKEEEMRGCLGNYLTPQHVQLVLDITDNISFSKEVRLDCLFV